MDPSDIERSFNELVKIIAKLRDPEGGCPWDLKQTHESLIPYMIEEAYEAVDAIQSNPAELPKELGDVLLQVVLHSQIASENGSFSILDVTEAVSKKMIDRHPHVFGNKTLKDEKAVLENWEESKTKERKENSGVFHDIPEALPSLIRSEKIGEIAARHNFDWPNTADVFAKVQEEIAEVEEELYEGTPAKLAEELGDLLFSVAQLVRKAGHHPESLLRDANRKFERRFQETLGSFDEHERPERPELERAWSMVKERENCSEK
jgi:MazG family protein